MARRRSPRQRVYTRPLVNVQTFLSVFVWLLVTALWLLILGRVLLSWINPRFEGPIARFLYDTTEPLLAPIRRLMPQTGMIDFSPLVLMLIMGVLVRLLWPR
jgi:YggT family protein